MNLHNECIISFYEEIAELGKSNNTSLVMHKTTKMLYVKKQVSNSCYPIYMKLKGMEVKGIPAVLEVIPDDDYTIVIEEYIHGRNLQDVVDTEGVMDVKEALGVGLKICDILTCLHSENPAIIHRDIKPSNIMLSNENNIYLVDFDASKTVKDGANGDTQLLGTQKYAAPEQYGFGQSDVRTDVYGLAATLNYLMSRKYPNEYICQNELSGALSTALQMDPQNRYQSISHFKMALCPEEKTEFWDFEKWFMRKSITVKECGKRAFLPPGFRGKSIINKLLASVWYFLVIYVSFSEDTSGSSFRNTALDSSFSFILLMAWTAWGGNYLGMRDYFPGMDNDRRAVRLSVGFLYIMLISLLLTMIFTILSSL